MTLTTGAGEMSGRDGPSDGRLLGRREVLVALGGAGAAALWLPSRVGAAVAGASPAGSSAAACVLTPELTSGPFYIANHLFSRDITERQPGLALTLHLKVQNATTCKAIRAANLEIWHANAMGVYSGFGSANSTFLRGHQITDATGAVTFDTVYPGWYRGRAPHIHIRVHIGGALVHTGQLFFADSISDRVYRTARYAAHGQPDIRDSQDSIYAQAGGARSRVALTKQANGGYLGTMTLAVRA